LELDSLGLHRSQKIERKRIVKRGKGKRMKDAGRNFFFPIPPIGILLFQLPRISNCLWPWPYEMWPMAAYKQGGGEEAAHKKERKAISGQKDGTMSGGGMGRIVEDGDI
jgi:hypothetical protein